MTSEKILKDAFDAGYNRCLYVNTDFGYSGDPDIEAYVSKSKSDIDELCKQEAIAFADFLSNENWFFMEQHGKYYPMKEMNPDENDIEFESKLATTEQLYELYIQSKQKP